MNKNSETRKWIEIGNKKPSEAKMSTLSSGSRSAGVKFNMRSIEKQHQDDKKVFRVSSKSKDSKKSQERKDISHSSPSTKRNLGVESWKIDESNIKHGLSMLGKVGFGTESMASRDFYNQTLEIQKQIKKSKQIIGVYEIRQQYSKFKEQVLKQLNQIQQTIGKVISDIILKFQRQMAKLAQTQRQLQQQKQMLSQVHIFKIQQKQTNQQKNTLKLSKMNGKKYQSLQQNYENIPKSDNSMNVVNLNEAFLNLSTVVSEKIVMQKLLKKEQLKSFVAAIQRLKNDMSIKVEENEQNYLINAESYISSKESHQC